MPPLPLGAPAPGVATPPLPLATPAVPPLLACRVPAAPALVVAVPAAPPLADGSRPETGEGPPEQAEKDASNTAQWPRMQRNLTHVGP